MTVEQKVKCAALEVAISYAMRRPKRTVPDRAVRNILELAERISGCALSPSRWELVYKDVLALLAKGVTARGMADCVEEAFGLRDGSAPASHVSP